MLNSTVRARLLKLVLAFMIPTALAAAGTIYYVHEEKQRQFERGLVEMTRALSHVVEREIARREAIVRTLAVSPLLARDDLQGFHEYARTVSPSIETVVALADLQGQQVLNTRKPFGDPGLPRHLLTPRQLQRAQRETVVSDLYFAPLGRQYSFAVTVPVLRDGAPRYLLSYAGYAAGVQQVVAEQDLPAGWLATVLDSTGVVVARNREPERFVGQSAAERLRTQIARGGSSGVFESVSLDGTSILASFNRPPGSGWSVVVGVPQEEIGSPTMAAARFALLALLLLGGALWTATRFGRGLVQPVLRLQQAAERIAGAQPIDAQPTGLKETDRVLEVLAQSSRAVQGANAQMQARVQQALAEADKAHQAVLQNQRLEALGQLTGGVAHDFNNLLMVVSNYTHLLRARRPELAGAQEVAGIERAVATGAKLTRQLLAFARRQAVRPERIELQTRLPEVAALLKASLGSRVALQCEVDPGTPPVRVDPAEFELALINLAVNARDAMPEGGTLRVQAGPAGEHTVQVSVADSGKGIPAELLSKVVEPFFTTKPVGHGTGLGLSQVYGFAQQAGGDARIASREGEGTTVTLLLPAARAGTDDAPAGPASQAAGVTPRGRSVLLVEDNGELASVTLQVLESAGLRVTRAENGDQARAMLQGGARCDIVLSDVRMPGATDGIALARWVREHHPGLPLVLMTGYSEELAQARNLGLEVLPKPSTPAAILETLARELRSAPQPEAVRAASEGA